MITINLYSFNKKPNSTKKPSGDGVALSCLVKTPSSIINPLVEVKENPLEFNYAYIGAFKRYYFINNITFNNGTWLLSLNVDVLASYKNVIGDTSIYITRNSNNYDTNIIDMYYPATTNVTTTIETGTAVTTADIINWTGFDNGYYVIGVQGFGAASVNGIIYYCIEPNELTVLLHRFYGNSGTDWWGNLYKGVINALNNVNDFIVSCRWYPVKPYTSGTQKIYLGTLETTVTGEILKDYPNTAYRYDFNIPRHPKASSRGSYLNYTPFSRYELVDNLVGTIPINPNIAKNYNKFRREIEIDFTTGECKYSLGVIIPNSGFYSFYTTFIKFGVDVQLTGTEVNVGGMLGSVAGATAGLITGDYLGAIASIGNAAALGYENPNTRPSAGSYTQLTGTASLYCYFLDIIDNNNANKGRPYCKINKPATVGGYIEAENPAVQINGTQDESNMINNYLREGFYYE